MSVAAETQCSKDVIVSIFHFLCFLMKTFTSHPFIFLFLVMSKNKEGSRSFIARMSSAYLITFVNLSKARKQMDVFTLA